MLEKMLEKRLL